MNPRLRAKCAASMAVCLISLAATRGAAADAITVAWDPVLLVAGYALYVTDPSGNSTRVDVGSATLFTYSNATAGQLYCFAVSSYLLPFLEGPRSGQVCGFSNAQPYLANPGNQISTVGQPVAFQLVGSEQSGQPLSYSATGLPSGLTLMGSTGFISGTPTSPGTYAVTATASDGVSTASQSFSWQIISSGAAWTGDGSPPTLAITFPTNATTYATTSSSISLSGTATDNMGVILVTWLTNRGASGIANLMGTSWVAGPIGLPAGSTDIQITASDASGNSATKVITVTSSATGASSPFDTTPPTVTITGPTSSDSSSLLTGTAVLLTGLASDDVGVTQVIWTNSLGGGGYATVTGGSWTAGVVALASGSNRLTVTARDAMGNVSSDVLTLTVGTGAGAVAAAAPWTSDSTPPTVTITGPTSSDSSSLPTGTAVLLTGLASDNVGVTQVTWTNSLGGSGYATVEGESWTAGVVALFSGSNQLTVTARDAMGNVSSDVLTLTVGTGAGAVAAAAPWTSDSTPPTVTITGPTSSDSSSLLEGTAVLLTGLAYDDVGVTQVTWANSLGGSGYASVVGGSWTAGVVALATGSNQLTVTARDAMGNLSSDVLTLTVGASVGTGAVAAAAPWTSDNTPPTVTITGPTSSDSSSLPEGSAILLTGLAYDDMGVTQVTWTNSLGGSGYATVGGGGWAAGIVALASGINTLTVTALDAAGNVSSDVLTLMVGATVGTGAVAAAAPWTSDSTPPTVTITGPTSSDSSSLPEGSAVVLSGLAYDDVGVTQVTWTNSLGGGGYATVVAGAWTSGVVSLGSGTNQLTVNARDEAGNVSWDVLTLTVGQ